MIAMLNVKHDVFRDLERTEKSLDLSHICLSFSLSLYSPFLLYQVFLPVIYYYYSLYMIPNNPQLEESPPSNKSSVTLAQLNGSNMEYIISLTFRYIHVMDNNHDFGTKKEISS